MIAYFISDLHLQSADEARTRILLRFLSGPATQARHLFILGDLFEAWVGDDDDAAVGVAVAAGLAALSARGVRVGLMHGNRDFLLGRDFARRAGAELLPEPCVIDLAGEATLLSHGDPYCSDDLPYQTLRRQLRDPRWQARFLAQPLAARKAFARDARQKSAEHQRQTTMELMDVNKASIEAALQLYGVNKMIHGHTHRPAEHLHRVDDRDCERWVLADWRDSGEALAVDSTGVWQRVRLD